MGLKSLNFPNTVKNNKEYCSIFQGSYYHHLCSINKPEHEDRAQIQNIKCGGHKLYVCACVLRRYIVKAWLNLGFSRRYSWWGCAVLAHLYKKVMDTVFNLYHAPISNLWLVADSILPNMAAPLYIIHMILQYDVDTPASRVGIYIPSSWIWAYLRNWLDLQSVAEMILHDFLGSATKGWWFLLGSLFLLRHLPLEPRYHVIRKPRP